MSSLLISARVGKRFCILPKNLQKIFLSSMSFGRCASPAIKLVSTLHFQQQLGLSSRDPTTFASKWVLMFNRNDRHTAVLLISDVERMVRWEGCDPINGSRREIDCVAEQAQATVRYRNVVERRGQWRWTWGIDIFLLRFFVRSCTAASHVSNNSTFRRHYDREESICRIHDESGIDAPPWTNAAVGFWDMRRYVTITG